MSAGAFALALATASAGGFVADPRIELLGAVQVLAGEPAGIGRDPVAEASVRAVFGRHSRHRAVGLYRELTRAEGLMDGTAIRLLHYGDPPELEPRREAPYLGSPSEAERWEDFLEALRAFARESGFMAKHAARRAELDAAVETAAREMGVPDPLSAVESYLGMPLDCRAWWIVSPWFVPSHRNAFIVPYTEASRPYPPGGWEVYTVIHLSSRPLADLSRVTQRHRPALWQEPLFVFVDLALGRFDEALGPRREAFYGPRYAPCRARADDCVKAALVAALSARLDALAFGAPSMTELGDPDRARAVTALVSGLERWEKRRRRSPSLWSEMPELMSWFAEKGGGRGRSPSLRPAARARELAAPPGVR